MKLSEYFKYRDIHIAIDSTRRYIIAKLPEGGEGVHGYDDGEGDD